METKLYFMVGLPRSGKSSYANTWAQQEYKRVIVCADDIRLSLTGERYCANAEGMVHTIKHLMISTLLRTGHTVLVDGTHTTERSIKDILKHDNNAEPIVIDTSEDICKARARLTQQDDLIPIIERMQNNLNNWTNEYHSIEEGIEEIRCN